MERNDMREPTYEDQVLILAGFVGNDDLPVEVRKEMIDGFCKKFNVTTERLEQDVMRMIKSRLDQI